MPPPSGPRHTEGKRYLQITLFVAGTALLSSMAGIQNEFAQDDIPLIRENLSLHQLGHLTELFTSPFWPSPYSPDLYRPLTSLFISIEFALGGGTPALFHIVSYLLYAAASVGVFALASRLVPRNIALGAAVLFAAHPVHVEAVALSVGQAELMVALIAVVMSIRYLDMRRTDSASPMNWLGLVALFAVASLFKEQGLIIPGLLLCVELCLVSGPVAQRLRAITAGYVGFAVVGVIVLLARRSALGGDTAGTFTAEALVGLGVGARALTMLQVVPRWTRLFFWPAHLQADYSPQEIVASHGLGPIEFAGLALLAMAVAAFVYARRRAPAVTFGLAWTAVSLLPVSNVFIPTGIVLAERTLFLPSIGVVIAAAGLVAALWPRVVAKRPGIARDLAFVCAAFTIVGVLRSAERQLVWRNDAFLSVRSVQDAPRSFRAWRAYGVVLFELHENKLAWEAFEQAIELSPSGLAWRVRNDFARRLREKDERVQEVNQLMASLAQEPNQEDTRGHLIAAYLNLGKYAEAAVSVDSAIAHGGRTDVFQGMRALADSALRVNAPAGSIKIGVTLGASQPVR